MSQTKMCPNGHVMDASWDRCPYCPIQMPRSPVPATRVHPALNGGIAPLPPPPPPPLPVVLPPPGRQTVIRQAEIAKQKAPPVVGWLVVLSGNHRGEDFRLREGKNAVGSAPDSDIVLTDPHVSSRHANIHSSVKDGERVYVVVDLDSRNGTFLNNSEEPVHREEIIDSDTVTFGTTVCKFKCI